MQLALQHCGRRHIETAICRYGERLFTFERRDIPIGIFHLGRDHPQLVSQILGSRRRAIFERVIVGIEAQFDTSPIEQLINLGTAELANAAFADHARADHIRPAFDGSSA